MSDKQSLYGFKIGDRVIFIVETDPDEGVVRGMTGTVCAFWEDDYADVGVRWDKQDPKYHDLGSKCENRHGWWVPHVDIALLDTDLGEIECSDESLESLFGIS